LLQEIVLARLNAGLTGAMNENNVHPL